MVRHNEELYRELVRIRMELQDIRKLLTQKNPPVFLTESEEVDMLKTLPDFLRKTYILVVKEGEASAVDISILTGRCRALESNYLNQLVRLGYLEGFRVHHEVRFMPTKRGDKHD